MIGFALVFFDINLNNLDVLPDALGFAIVAYGAALLKPLHAWAVHAVTISVGLALVSGFRLVASLNGTVYAANLPGRLMELVESAGIVALLWILFQITIELAVRLNAASLAGEARTHRFFLTILVLGGAATGALFAGEESMLEAGADVGVIVIAVFLLFALALILVLRVFMQASNLCRYGRLWPPGGGWLPPRRR